MGWLRFGFLLCCVGADGLEQCAELLVESCLCGSTDKLVDQLTSLEEEDGGDVTHSKLDGDIVVLVYVALAYEDASIVVGSEFTDDGTHHAARTAPGCPKVYTQRQFAIAIAQSSRW